MQVNLDISKSILELQSIDYVTPTQKSKPHAFNSAAISEKRNILQRALNLQESSATLLNYIRENRTQLYGELPSQTSEASIDITLGEEQNNIATVGAFSSIKNGTFKVNGYDISIDTSTESLQDVIDKINAAETGAEASYDFSNNTLTISATTNKPLLLENGSSDFFSATKLKTGYISTSKTSNLDTFLKSSPTQELFNRFTSRYNRFMNSDFDLAGNVSFRDALNSLSNKAIKSYIQNDFKSGAIKLDSNVSLHRSESSTLFTSNTISFSDEDSPSNFFNFLSAENGILPTLASLTGNHTKELKKSLSSNNPSGILYSRSI
jgi:hypothetical protein